MLQAAGERAVAALERVKRTIRRFERYTIYPDSVFALSILLFGVSLALPVLITDPLAHKYAEVCLANYGSPHHPSCTWGIVPAYIFGIELLASGWTHISMLQIAAFAWLANPLVFAAFYYVRNSAYRDAYTFSGAAALVGLLALDYPSIVFSFDNNTSYMTAHLGFGYALWEAALIIFFAYCRALYRSAPPR